MENNKLFEELNDDELELVSGGRMQVGRKLVITQSCISCHACADACVVNAIHEDGDKFKINQDECMDCGECKNVCPNEAIIYA